jgi:protein SCO1
MLRISLCSGSYRVWLGLAAFFLSLPSARAVTRDDLAQVAAAPSPGAQVPTDLSVRVLDRPDVTLGSLIDRPTVLLFADYTCHTLCGPIVAFTGHALGDSGLQQGSDYQLVVIGIDPKVDPAAARSMKQAQLGPADRATFLLPDEMCSIEAARSCVCFRASGSTPSTSGLPLSMPGTGKLEPSRTGYTSFATVLIQCRGPTISRYPGC